MGLLPFRFLLKTRYAGLTNHFSIQRHPVTAPAREFLAEVHRVRASGGGTGERSFYGAFQNLVNAVGRSLKPKVFCVNELADLGAGRPDFGFYSADRLPRDIAGGDPLATPPDRGVVEMKAPGDDLWSTLRGPQVEAYWYRYGLILVTNLRGFVLVGKDQFGRRIDVEEFLLRGEVGGVLGVAAGPRRLSARSPPVDGSGRVLMTAAVADRRATWGGFRHLRRVFPSPAGERLRPAGTACTAWAAARDAEKRVRGHHFRRARGVHLFPLHLVCRPCSTAFRAWVCGCGAPRPGGAQGF